MKFPKDDIVPTDLFPPKTLQDLLLSEEVRLCPLEVDRFLKSAKFEVSK